MRDDAVVKTLQYYEENSLEITSRYEQVDSSRFLEGLPIWVATKSKVLDLGCGSGRDAAFLLSEEYDVQGLDGSSQMISAALSLHPELTDRLTCRELPDVLPYADETFHAVISIAFFMHLDTQQILQVCKEVHRILQPHGVLWLSVRLPASDDPVPAESQVSFDDLGRHMLKLSADQWKSLLGQAGFFCKKFYHDDDTLGRSCRWGRFAFVKDPR